MRFYFDLGLSKLIQRPGFPSLLTGVGIKRGDSQLAEMDFSRDGVAEAITGTPTEMVFVVKASRAPTAVPLVLANDWTLDGVTGLWSSAMLADNAALQTALGTEASKTFYGEFTWTTAETGTTSSQTINVTVENDVWKGTEGTPLVMPTPAEWLMGATAPVNGTESAVVVVTSSTAPDLSDTYQFAGVGTVANYYFSTLFPADIAVYRNPETGMWLIAFLTAAFDEQVTPATRFQSSDNVAYPWLVTTWVGYSDLSGQTVTSVVEDPGTATLAPPHFRVTADKLYVRDSAGVWKELPLYALGTAP